MAYYDEQLQLLQQQVVNKKRIESKLQEFRSRRGERSTKVEELSKITLEEQEDVEKLEGRSLAAFFYNVIGKMDEKLDKERQEAYEARVRYDAAAYELSMIDGDIQRLEQELNQIAECEQKYETLLQEKSELVKLKGSKEAFEIFQLEKNIAYMESQIREMKEALGAGEKALGITGDILTSLNRAEDWGTWDLMGGGMLSDMAKHSHLDEAQKKVEYLQVQLLRFKSELTDVTIHADIQVSIDGFLGFADYFFDGLFADWAVLDRINQSQEQVKDTKSKINKVIKYLTAMLQTTEDELYSEKIRLDEVIVKASI